LENPVPANAFLQRKHTSAMKIRTRGLPVQLYRAFPGRLQGGIGIFREGMPAFSLYLLCVQAGKKGGADSQGQCDAFVHGMFCIFSGLIALCPNLIGFKDL
ncbi:MAG TPA: hypothetical protein DCF33_11250, partial [Saprospirales bacterium]|nr:hypothetical protein [Saprospirales bacterium]